MNMRVFVMPTIIEVESTEDLPDFMNGRGVWFEVQNLTVASKLCYTQEYGNFMILHCGDKYFIQRSTVVLDTIFDIPEHVHLTNAEYKDLVKNITDVEHIPWRPNEPSCILITDKEDGFKSRELLETYLGAKRPIKLYSPSCVVSEYVAVNQKYFGVKY